MWDSSAIDSVSRFMPVPLRKAVDLLVSESCIPPGRSCIVLGASLAHCQSLGVDIGIANLVAQFWHSTVSFVSILDSQYK